MTYTATGGEFIVMPGTTDGATGDATTSFTVTGLQGDINQVLQNTIFTLYMDLNGNATISATSSDSLVTVQDGIVQSVTSMVPVTRTETVPVTPYDDGSYEASVTDLRTIGQPDGSSQGPSFNCHGWSFSATGIVCPDGQTRSFQIFDDNDAKTILSDANKPITAKDAMNLLGGPTLSAKLVFVFYDAAGNPIHSACNWNTSQGRYFLQFGLNPADGTLNSNSTHASTKNGDQLFQPDVSLAQLWAVYSQKQYGATSIKIYTLK